LTASNTGGFVRAHTGRRQLEDERLVRVQSRVAAGVHGLDVSSEVAVCAPYVYLAQVAMPCRHAAASREQNLSADAPGAAPPEIGAEMLLDCGSVGIVGIRTPQPIRRKHAARRGQGGTGVVTAEAIICVGETLHEREAGPDAGGHHRQLAPVFDACRRRLALRDRL